MFSYIKRLLFEESCLIGPNRCQVRHEDIISNQLLSHFDRLMPEEETDHSVDQDFELITRFYEPQEIEDDELAESKVQVINNAEITALTHFSDFKDGIQQIVTAYQSSVPNFLLPLELPSIPDLPRQSDKDYITPVQNNDQPFEMSAKQQTKLLNQRAKLDKLLFKILRSEFDLMLLEKNYSKVHLAKLQLEMYQKIKAFDEENKIDVIAADLYEANLKYIAEELANIEKFEKLELEKQAQSDQQPSANPKPINSSEVKWIDDDLEEGSTLPRHIKNHIKNTRQQRLLAQSDTPSQKSSDAQKPLDEYFADFIGLQVVREEIKKIIAFLQVQKMREAQGFTMKSPPSRHMVFTGNPGTGKTEMARLIAQIMYDKGIVSQNTFIEADRSDLIAEYLGQTALKTKGLIEKAFGGVLFIDEAYTLKTREDDMYGDEAIATLLKMMEDHRDKVTVIVAGYQDEMQTFIETNPGLKSRFNRFIDFPDYEDEELFQILLKMIESNHYKIANIAQVKPLIDSHLGQQRHILGDTFANARTVRNYFEKIIEQQSLRVIERSDMDINVITATDCYV